MYKQIIMLSQKLINNLGIRYQYFKYLFICVGSTLATQIAAALKSAYV